MCLHNVDKGNVTFTFTLQQKKLIEIQINQPTICISLSDLLLVVHIQLNMFRASSCPSSGAYKLQ